MEKVRAYDPEAAAAHAQTEGAACMAAVNGMAVADAVYEQRPGEDVSSQSGGAVNSGAPDRGHRQHRGKRV
jgi:hypothetical protein